MGAQALVETRIRIEKRKLSFSKKERKMVQKRERKKEKINMRKRR